jgi:uncharacterized membrane protein
MIDSDSTGAILLAIGALCAGAISALLAFIAVMLIHDVATNGFRTINKWWRGK